MTTLGPQKRTHSMLTCWGVARKVAGVSAGFSKFFLLKQIRPTVFSGTTVPPNVWGHGHIYLHTCIVQTNHYLCIVAKNMLVNAVKQHSLQSDANIYWGPKRLKKNMVVQRLCNNASRNIATAQIKKIIQISTPKENIPETT